MHALLILILLLPYAQNSKQPKTSSPSSQRAAAHNPEGSSALAETSDPTNQRSTSGQKQNDPFWDAPTVTAMATVLYVLVTIALCIGVFFQVRAYWQKERAWMVGTIQRVGATHADKGIVRFTGQIVNVGHSPARILHADPRHLIIKRQDSLPRVPPYISDPKGEQTFYVIAPSNWTPFYVDVLQADVSDIDKGERVLWIFGRIQYRDIFNRKRESRFCFRYYPGIPGSNNPEVGFFPDGPPNYHKLS